MGERSKNIGDEAENKVLQFINDLGYEIDETNLEKYDIDVVAKSPENEPEVGIGKPCYSPSGLVAFEIKQPNVTSKRIEKFAKKILKYNQEKDEKLHGGIYIADCKISRNMLKYMNDSQIYGWGQKRTRLYREKVNAFYYWSKKKAFVKEIPIEKNISYLQIATPPPTDFNELLHFTVICDDLDTRLSPKIVKRLMNKMKEISLAPLIERGIIPVNAYFEFYSIGGFGKLDQLILEINRKIIQPWKEEQISVKVGKFSDFRTFVTL